ncbi:nucleotide exchange factor GrpE [Patescibacteria group bacterium]|nr:nucleotide exchange factor GrpE [Patescibacteria group bacterium]MBU1906583.1 nucleotide exchange factor GrpE [Patescibacteria group bacterium]
MKDKNKQGANRTSQVDQELETTGDERLATCKQCDEYLLGWKRALADYDNLQKDLAREKTEMRAYVIEEFFHKLIPVIDHFDQAMKHVPENIDEATGKWIEGVEHIQQSLIDIAKEFACEPIDPADEQFDPMLHEAISTQSDDSQPDEIVIEVLERGWQLGNKVIRPAKVIVNKVESKE